MRAEMPNELEGGLGQTLNPRALLNETTAELGGLDTGPLPHELAGDAPVDSGDGGSTAVAEREPGLDAPRKGRQRGRQSGKPESAVKAPKHEADTIGGGESGDGAAAPESSAAHPAPSSVLRDYFKSKGYDVSGYAKDEDLESELQETMRTHQEMPDILRLAAIGRRYAPHGEKIEQWMREQAGQTQQTQEKPPETRQPEAKQTPEWQKKPPHEKWWGNVCTVDPSGTRYILKDEYVGKVDSSIPEKLMVYAKWKDEADDLYGDFPGLIQKYGPKLDGYVKVDDLPRMFDEHLRTSQQRSRSEEMVRQNLGLFYELDGQGRIKVDPRTGGEQLSPIGQLVQHHANSLRQAGLTDQQQIEELAMLKTEADINRWQNQQGGGQAGATAKPAAKAAPQKTVAEKKAEGEEGFVTRAIKSAKNEGNRGGGQSIVNETNSNGKRFTDKQLLRALANESAEELGGSLNDLD